MTLFQCVTIPVLMLLIASDLVGYLRRKTHRRWPLLRVGIWLGAVVALAVPNMTTQIAIAVGIQRGADLVLYSFALAFLGTTFYFYSRYVRLQQQIVELVRQQALHKARFGADAVAPQTLKKAA